MSSIVSNSDLLQCAVSAARAAGNHALENSSRRREVSEKSQHDVKLALDRECQQKAEQVIQSAFREHKILGEEWGFYHEGDEHLWIIDPIDGTVNFMHGLPFWCSSIAVRHRGEIVAGAVYLPAMKECYTATADSPAFCNDEPIHVSDVEQLEDALVLGGLSKHLGKDNSTLDTFIAMSQRAQKSRLMGAAAVDLCNVACGRADGYFESMIHLWDIAAGGLIVQRAGGKAEVLEQIGDVSFRYLCSNGRVHGEMKEILVSTLGGEG